MLGFRQEVRVAHRMQDETFATAQQHDATGPGQLMVQVLHHRCGEVDQAAVSADDNAQIRFIDPPDLADTIMSDAKSRASLPGSFDEIGDDSMRYASLAEELSIRAADRRHVGGKLL